MAAVPREYTDAFNPLRLDGSDFEDANRKHDSILELRTMHVIVKGRADRDHDFPGMVEQEQTFRISSRGIVQEDAEAKPLALPFYMGDLRAIVFEPPRGKSQLFLES